MAPLEMAHSDVANSDMNNPGMTDSGLTASDMVESPTLGEQPTGTYAVVVQPRMAEGLRSDQHKLNHLETRVLRALNEYKERMKDANEQFILNRVAEIQEKRHDELARLNLMARFWHHGHRWPLSTASPVTHRLRQANLLNEFDRRSESVTCLDDVKRLPHPHMDGTIQSTLPDCRVVDIVLKALEVVARIKSDPRVTVGLSMSVPDDIRYFLEHTDGLRDPDFRDEGMPPWTLCDLLETDKLDDLDAFAEEACSHWESLLIDDTSQLSSKVLSVLEVAAGYVTRDRLKDEDQETWRSYYLFCRYAGSRPSGRNHGWAWRIVFERKYDDPPFPGCAVPICDNIFELMTWYSLWIQSPNLKDMVQMIYDEDSDPNADPLELKTIEGLANDNMT